MSTEVYLRSYMYMYVHVDGSPLPYYIVWLSHHIAKAVQASKEGFLVTTYSTNN